MDNFNKFDPVFQDNGVVFAVVFGSIYRNEDTEDSDIDIAVYMSGSPKKPNYMDRYIRLLDELDDISDHRVDISDLKTCRDSFARRISENCRVIYDPEGEAENILTNKKSDAPSKQELDAEIEKLRGRINKDSQDDT